MSNRSKTTAHIARNSRLTKEAEAKRDIENATRIADATKLSNAPLYTTDDCIHDILSSSTLSAKGGVGLVVNIFNNADEWSLAALTTYFAASKSQSVLGADGKRKIDKSITTRPKMLYAFLARNEEYQSAVAQLNAAKTALKTAKKSKPVSHENVSRFTVEADSLAGPIRAVEAKLHRAFIAAYQCRVAGYINVRLGPTNELLVTHKSGKEERFTETSIRDAGTDALKKEGHIKSRPARAKTNEVKALSAVDAKTAGPVMDSLSKLIEANGLPVTSEDDNVMTLERIATFALESVTKVSESKAQFSDELRGTLSDIAVAIFTVLKVKTIKEATALSKKAGRPS